MTAHRCCPECGAELTADGRKFCGCVGPFTAERVDPMHIRPYVDLPEPEDAELQTPDLEPFARCGRAETAKLPVLRPYGDDGAPAGLAASGHDQGHDAGHDQGHDAGQEHDLGYGGPEAGPAAVPSAARGGSHRRGKGRGAYVYGRDEGAGRRRRPARAALAMAGVVAALGAGILTTHALTNDQGGDDRNLSTDDNPPPDGDGGPSKDSSGTEEHKSGKKSAGKPTSRSGSGSHRADRDSERNTGRASAAPGTPSPEAPGTPGEPDGNGNGNPRGGGGGHDRDRDSRQPSQEPTQPEDETLRQGDVGPEVAELQRRLKQAGVLDEDAPEDGVYSRQVRQAVAKYQARNGVRGDETGEYGPNTRRSLEGLVGAVTGTVADVGARLVP